MARRTMSRRALADALWAIPAVDHHAHGIVAVRPTLDEFRGMFSESPDPAQWPHVATGLTYRRAMRELGAFLGCEPGEDGVYAHRLAADFDDYSAALLRASATGLLLIDDGYPAPGEGYGWERMGELAGCPARPVMRIERVAEEGALGRASTSSASGCGPRSRPRASRGFVGPEDDRRLPHRPRRAPARCRGRAGGVRGGGHAPASPSPCSSWRCGTRSRRTRPIRCRCRCTPGSATPTCSCRAPTRPGSSRRSSAIRATPFVLLHCYPFVREAGWLAHVYGNVYFDLSLTIPHVSRPAEMVRQALELAPVSKLLYASDAARTPELYLLAARWWREALAEVLAEALPAAEAERAGAMILRENAHAVYPLG